MPDLDALHVTLLIIIAQMMIAIAFLAAGIYGFAITYRQHWRREHGHSDQVPRPAMQAADRFQHHEARQTHTG